MMRHLISLLRCRSGAAAGEFAMIVPLLMIVMLGIIDTGRYMWDVNRAEKATQAGARVAIVTDAVSPGLIDEDYAGKNVGGTLIQPGGNIPLAALGTIKCTSTGCVCETAPCPSSLGTLNSTIFNNVLVARMQLLMPTIKPENVVIRYSGSGLGTAGSIGSSSGGGGGGGGGPADSMEVSPLITVSLQDMTFTPAATLTLLNVKLPTAETTLSAEDVSGSYSN